ncbi:MAG: carboxypeptidase-like regulatory domain-containing protein [Candidatus Eisenbacteria bacterium]
MARSAPPRGPLRDPVGWMLILVALGAILYLWEPLIHPLGGALVAKAKQEVRIHEIRGTVVDYESHRPVAGARIELSTWAGMWNPTVIPWQSSNLRIETLTDTLGRFAFRTRLEDDARIEATAAEYLGSSNDLSSDSLLMIPMLRLDPDHEDAGWDWHAYPCPVEGKPIHLDLAIRSVVPVDSAYDVAISLRTRPDTAIVIRAAHGRSIRFDPQEWAASPWIHAPINGRGAPAEGYVDSLVLRGSEDPGLCFVRRETRPRYTALSLVPADFLPGWRGVSSGTASVFLWNREGGRGLYDERTTYMAQSLFAPAVRLSAPASAGSARNP